MTIKRIRVQNFRIHKDFTVDFSPKSTLISGPNGSGKTSLIEAVFLSFQGTSFRSSDKEIIKNDTKNTWFRIDIEDTEGFVRTVKFDNSLVNGKKQFIIDGAKKYRLPANNKEPIVIFEPDDLQLLSGSPNRRRLFIDRFLSQLYPEYSAILSRYNKALKQRNTLLKNEHISTKELFPWNLMLADLGCEIIEKRQKIISEINKRINETYFNITGVKDNIEFVYDSNFSDRSSVLSILEKDIDKDKILGHTSFGPHKHDITIKFNEVNAKNVASRGENRSLVLALKFIETDILSEYLEKSPIVLLDDVFSELDETRQKLLTRHFSRYQTIITSTNYVDVEDAIVVKII